MSDIAMPTSSKPISHHNSAEAAGAGLDEQVTRLREDLADLARTVAEIGTSRVEQTGSDIAEASQTAVQTVQEEVATIETDVRKTIRENPLQAIGVAAGIGFIAALLTRH